MIFAPKRRLKALQRHLNELLVWKLPVSTHAHGFVTGRSIRTGADPHVGRAFVLHLDLKDFFPSVTFARVRGLLIAHGYAYPVAATLAALCTEARRQPVEIDGELFHVPVGQRHCVQGAPTSPGLCNAMVLRLGRRVVTAGSASDASGGSPTQAGGEVGETGVRGSRGAVRRQARLPRHAQSGPGGGDPGEDVRLATTQPGRCSRIHRLQDYTD